MDRAYVSLSFRLGSSSSHSLRRFRTWFQIRFVSVSFSETLAAKVFVCVACYDPYVPVRSGSVREVQIRLTNRVKSNLLDTIHCQNRVNIVHVCLTCVSFSETVRLNLLPFVSFLRRTGSFHATMSISCRIRLMIASYSRRCARFGFTIVS